MSQNFNLIIRALSTTDLQRQLIGKLILLVSTIHKYTNWLNGRVGVSWKFINIHKKNNITLHPPTILTKVRSLQLSRKMSLWKISLVNVHDLLWFWSIFNQLLVVKQKLKMQKTYFSLIFIQVSDNIISLSHFIQFIGQPLLTLLNASGEYMNCITNIFNNIGNTHVLSVLLNQLQMYYNNFLTTIVFSLVKNIYSIWWQWVTMQQTLLTWILIFLLDQSMRLVNITVLLTLIINKCNLLNVYNYTIN